MIVCKSLLNGVEVLDITAHETATDAATAYWTGMSEFIKKRSYKNALANGGPDGGWAAGVYTATLSNDTGTLEHNWFAVTPATF